MYLSIVNYSERGSRLNRDHQLILHQSSCGFITLRTFTFQP